MNFRSVLAVVSLLTVIVGCNKFDDDPVYHGIIKNTLAQPVHLDFYGTREAYDNSSNPIYSVTIPANGSVEVPQGFEGGSKMYLDWYSDDFMNTNWGTDPKFTVANVTPELDPVMTISQKFTHARKVWLDGNKPSTRWKAFDYRQFQQTSYWNLLAPHQQDRQLLVRKNLTGVYTYKDIAGITHNLDFVFGVSSGSFSNSTLFVSFTATGGSYNLSQAENQATSEWSIDTVLTSSFFPPETTGSSSYNYFYHRY